MQLKKTRLLAAGIGSAAMLVAAGAHANLVYMPLDNQLFTGSGLGAVNTVLTVSSPNSTSTETGSVFAAGTSFATSGDALTGTSQVGLPTLGALGISNVRNLRIILNATEPSGNSIIVSNLALSFYNATGATLGTFSLAAPVTFASTLTGVGQAGFTFGLDAAQGATAAALLGSNLSNVRVGLAATLSDATGGPDTFFIGNAPGNVAAVPEPETYALMLAGLGVVGFMSRRRQR